MTELVNPFRPGAGHPPPYLAGREAEKERFLPLLAQERILENLVLTGLRGIGKTVLLDVLQRLAAERGWLWVGADLSERTSLSEGHLATRLCADLAFVLSAAAPARATETGPRMGFGADLASGKRPLDYEALIALYSNTPGLSVDKMKAVLEAAWERLSQGGRARGIVFAYDEAQTLIDRPERDEFPASVLLDAFQSLQRRGLPLMLVLAGLPMLPSNLVETRTYAERMFHVLFLDRLNPEDSREAITRPIARTGSRLPLSEKSVDAIVKLSGGYPYFIQFICKEVYDAFIHRLDRGQTARVPVREIQEKLDADFFAARWGRATDRQRELMSIIAGLKGSDEEFMVRDIVEGSHRSSGKPFSSSHVNQMLAALTKQGFVFRNRHGKYAFAVPLLRRFIRRRSAAR